GGTPARPHRGGGEREREGGRVVVDDERGLGAGESREKRREMVLPGAALPMLEVVLEVRVAGADLRDPGERRLRERRATEVRVDEDAGRVQHAAKARLPRAG